jgi:hypothetical protein
MSADEAHRSAARRRLASFCRKSSIAVTRRRVGDERPWHSPTTQSVDGRARRKRRPLSRSLTQTERFQTTQPANGSFYRSGFKVEISQQSFLRRSERCQLDPRDGIFRTFRSRAMAFIDSPAAKRVKISRTVPTSEGISRSLLSKPYRFATGRSSRYCSHLKRRMSARANTGTQFICHQPRQPGLHSCLRAFAIKSVEHPDHAKTAKPKPVK